MRTAISRFTALTVFVLALPVLVALLATSFLGSTVEPYYTPTPLPTQTSTSVPTSTPTPRPTPTPITDVLLKSLDLSTYSQIPSPEKIDSGTIPLDLKPAAGSDYWELRYVRPGLEEGDPNYIVLAAGGSRATAGLSQASAAKVDAIMRRGDVDGFGWECFPAWCFKYIVTVSSDNVEVLLYYRELRTFLGEIDTLDEAILLAEVLGYGWGDDKQEAAIREVTDGYDLVVLDWIPSAEKCDGGAFSYDTYRVLLHLSRSGTGTEQSKELLKQGHGCAVA